MRRYKGGSIGSGSVPTLRIVYKGSNLIDEFDSIRTADSATHLTLKVLGEDLMIEEGLQALDDEAAQADADTILIPWDDTSEE